MKRTPPAIQIGSMPIRPVPVGSWATRTFLISSPRKPFGPSKTELGRYRWSSGRELMARSNALFLIKLLFLFKVVPEVIDSVMDSFQLGRIKGQIRTIEATNIRMMNLLLVIHPSIGRLQTRDVSRQTSDIIVRWNYSLRIIFPDNCIDLSAGKY